MVTQTTRWDAEAVRRRKTQHAAGDSAALNSHFLIANPRLTFDLSCTKHSLLKISNRERIAIFCSLKGESEKQSRRPEALRASGQTGGTKGDGDRTTSRWEAIDERDAALWRHRQECLCY
jgi:hypothetical protein